MSVHEQLVRYLARLSCALIQNNTIARNAILMKFQQFQPELCTIGILKNIKFVESLKSFYERYQSNQSLMHPPLPKRYLIMQKN